jgi:hypothetical protein
MSDMRRKRNPWRLVLGLVGLGLVAAVVITISLDARRMSRRFTCGKNLQSLVDAFHSYSAGLTGAPFASSGAAIQAMIDAGVVSAEQTVSPITGLQFVFAYPGGYPVPQDFDTRVAIAYEPLPKTNVDCGWIAFADGHGECVSVEKYEVIVAAGRNTD